MSFPDRFSGYWIRLRQVPGADEPLVRWGVVGIAAILLWSMLLDPWGQAIREQRVMLSAHTMELARLQVLQSQTGAWGKAERQFGKAMQAAAQGLLQKTSATAAQSELQGLLQRMVKRHHLKLESQHFMPVTDEPGLGKRVAIQLRLVGPMANAYRFLDALARQNRLLVIEKMNLGRRGSGDMGLFVQVAGFMAAPEGNS